MECETCVELPEMGWTKAQATWIIRCDENGWTFRTSKVCDSCAEWIWGRLKCPFDGSIEHDHTRERI